MTALREQVPGKVAVITDSLAAQNRTFGKVRVVGLHPDSAIGAGDYGTLVERYGVAAVQLYAPPDSPAADRSVRHLIALVAETYQPHASIIWYPDILALADAEWGCANEDCDCLIDLPDRAARIQALPRP